MRPANANGSTLTTLPRWCIVRPSGKAKGAINATDTVEYKHDFGRHRV
jgi:hypothetical protein